MTELSAQVAELLKRLEKTDGEVEVLRHEVRQLRQKTHDNAEVATQASKP